MPRYFFNVRDGHDIHDVDGFELPDFKAARREAIRLSGALLENEADEFDAGEVWQMEVSDETGLLLFLMTFSVMESPAVQELPDRQVTRHDRQPQVVLKSSASSFSRSFDS